MLELLNQLDGFASDDRIKVLAATNRVDVLDPALLRSGRLDRKIEFPLPNEEARAQILKIHSRKMKVDPGVNWGELARSTDEFGGAMLKAVCVEAGMIALRSGKNKIGHEHYVDAIAEVQAKKKDVSDSKSAEDDECDELTTVYRLSTFTHDAPSCSGGLPGAVASGVMHGGNGKTWADTGNWGRLRPETGLSASSWLIDARSRLCNNIGEMGSWRAMSTLLGCLRRCCSRRVPGAMVVPRRSAPLPDQRGSSRMCILCNTQ